MFCRNIFVRAVLSVRIHLPPIDMMSSSVAVAAATPRSLVAHEQCPSSAIRTQSLVDSCSSWSSQL